MIKDPHSRIAFKQMALQALQQQRFAEAISYATKACNHTPRDAELWLIQAIAHSHTGGLVKAEQHSRKAVTLSPAHPGAYLVLGNILQARGKLQDAAIAYQDAIKRKPDLVEAINNLGSLLRTLGRLEEAEGQLRRALTIMPGSPVIMTNLGLLEKDKGNHSDAIEIFESILKSHPDNTDAHVNLANLLQLHGKAETAETHYRTAIGFNPENAMAMHGLGQLLSSQGKVDEALPMLDHASKLRPDLQDIPAAIADIYEKQGDVEMALIVLKPLLVSKPVSPGASLCFAKLAPHLNRQEEAIKLLTHQLTNPALPSQIKLDFHFALGKLHDSLGKFEDAFENFSIGNTKCAMTHAVTEASITKLNLIKECFSHDSQKRAPRSGNTSDKPVFIVGMPRAGTTLVEQILSSHPLISGAGELPYMGDLLNSLPERLGPSRSYPSCIDEMKVSDLNEMAGQYLDKLSMHAPGAARITDKMPHNFLHLGLIDRLFPNARIIHCVRNPLDTCLSIYFHNFSGNHPYTTELHKLGKYYKEYSELMAHWRSSIRLPMLDVIYEDLVANQEKVSRDMISFCGVDWDEQCLVFNKSERTVNTPSYNQVRQPIYTTSVNRWKNYEAFLEPLITALE